MRKFKGYNVVDFRPEDAWLKCYFYVNRPDIKNDKVKMQCVYRDLGYIRHKDYILHLLNVKEGEKILDVGCQDGAMMVYCGLLGAEVYGIDLSAESIEEANRHLDKYALKGKAIIGDARKINFADNYFDKIVSSDFFEHLSPKDNILVLKEIKRVLKPGGIFVIKSPNLTYLRLSRLCKMIMRAIRLKNPFDVVIAHTTGNNPLHIGLATKRRMIEIVKSAGFLNFRFHYDINYKIERFNYSLGEFFAEAPFLRDCFTEDLIAVIYKPIILSFFE